MLAFSPFLRVVMWSSTPREAVGAVMLPQWIAYGAPLSRNASVMSIGPTRHCASSTNFVHSPNKPAPSATCPCSLPRGGLVIEAHTIVAIADYSAAQHVTANSDASMPDACQRSQVTGLQIARAAEVGPILDAAKLRTAQIVDLDSDQFAKLLSHATCAKWPFAVIAGSWSMASASGARLRLDSI
jgi:hypothetical protein